MTDYSKITLGKLLSSENETIKRHAVGILKQYQKQNKQCCWAQVGNDYCKNTATRGDYCKRHADMFPM